MCFIMIHKLKSKVKDKELKIPELVVRFHLWAPFVDIFYVDKYASKGNNL